MARKSSFLRSVLTAMCLTASASASAQEPTITLGQVGRILTPSGITHSRGASFDFEADFDGRTIKLYAPLIVMRLDQKSEDSTPPVFVNASCGPERVMSMLSGDKYIDAILAKVHPGAMKNVPAVWIMEGEKRIALASLLNTQGYSTAIVSFGRDSAVNLLRGLYESRSHIDLVLYEVNDKVLAPSEWQTIRIQVNRQNAKSMSALAQTLSFCETMLAVRR